MTRSTNSARRTLLVGSTLPIVFIAFLTDQATALAAEPKFVSGLRNLESVAVGPGGKIYVTLTGERDTKKDGSVAIVDITGKITPFAIGLDDPKGLVAVRDFLYVVDVKKIWKIDNRGKAQLFIAPEAFPRLPMFLNDIAFDGLGNFYVSDSGDRTGKKGVVFRIDSRRQVTVVLDGELSSPLIYVPSGLISDDPDHLFVADAGLGLLYRFDLITGTAEQLGGGFGGTNGITKDRSDRMYIGDGRNGRLFRIDSELEPSILLSEKFRSITDLTLSANGRYLLITDGKAGTLTWYSIP